MSLREKFAILSVFFSLCMQIRTGIFGRWNLLTSLGHEDVAYASYVYEYSTGHFSGALSNSKTALEVMDRLLPENHLLMASAKRVCALILEVHETRRIKLSSLIF